MCGCSKSSFNGQCTCNQSNFTGMKNHLTDEQIRNIRNKFEDNLFFAAYYSDEEDSNDFLGIGKKKKEKEKTADPATPKKKFDLKKIANDGLGLIQKAKDLLKGNAPAISGDYEGTQYEATINTEPEPQPQRDKPDDKKIMGMPPAVFYTGLVLVVAFVIFLFIKLASKQPQIKQL